MFISLSIISWLGAFLLLLGYFVLSRGNPDGRVPAHWLNLLAGLLLGTYCLYTHAWAMLFLNIVWIVIAIESITTEPW